MNGNVIQVRQNVILAVHVLLLEAEGSASAKKGEYWINGRIL
jgi:hypothetical protein